MYYNHNGIFLFTRGFPEFPVSFRFGDQQPTLQETEAPGLADVEMSDAGRSWSADTQTMVLTFTEAVTADATGWAITVNGVAKTLTYVSGSGTTDVTFQMNTVKHDNDVVVLSYDPTSGATVSVTGSIEIKAIPGVVLNGRMTRRVRFTLCDSADAVVANEAVKAAIFEYHNAVVADEITQGPTPNWMTRANAATVTTDAAGLFDMEYTGFLRGGGSVYVAIVRANGESLIVQATIQ